MDQPRVLYSYHRVHETFLSRFFIMIIQYHPTGKSKTAKSRHIPFAPYDMSPFIPIRS